MKDSQITASPSHIRKFLPYCVQFEDWTPLTAGHHSGSIGENYTGTLHFIQVNLRWGVSSSFSFLPVPRKKQRDVWSQVTYKLIWDMRFKLKLWSVSIVQTTPRLKKLELEALFNRKSVHVSNPSIRVAVLQIDPSCDKDVKCQPVESLDV